MFKWFDEARSRELFERHYIDLDTSYLNYLKSAKLRIDKN